MMRYIIILGVVLTASGCNSLIGDGVVKFCSESGYSKIILDTNNNKYRTLLNDNSDEGDSGRIIYCGTRTHYCMDGPFFLYIKREDLKNSLDRDGLVNFNSVKDETLYKFLYSKSAALEKVSIVLNYDGVETTPPLEYSRCPFEFDDLTLPEGIGT